jgi:hypothetical protein
MNKVQKPSNPEYYRKYFSIFVSVVISCVTSIPNVEEIFLLMNFNNQ